MKKNVLFLISLLIFLTYSCNGDGENSASIKAIEVTPEKVELGIGETQYIKANPVPADVEASELPLQWNSNNIQIATVSPSGMVKGVSAGKAEITVSAKVSTGITKKVPVTVIDNSIPLTGITVTPETVSLETGKSIQITATPVPANATGVSFTWESADEEIASVNSTGIVSGKAKGTTTITVKSGDIKKEIPVTVTHTLRIVIGNTTYDVDTLNYEVLSGGIHWLKFSIPEFVNGFGTLGKGLVVNAVEVDLTFPENKVEVWPAKLRAGDNRETPSQVYTRKKNEYEPLGRKPVVTMNGDFFLLDADAPANYAYVRRRPLGMEVTNGMLIQTPYSNDFRVAFVIRDDGLPEQAGTVSFSGTVNTGNTSFSLKEVNGYANAGDLVLFNNQANSYLGSDSALAWSPYPSTMVSLTYPEGGWRVNDRMEFTVTGIEYDVETKIPAASPYGGKRFNGEGAILVGNSASSTVDNASKLFLSNLSVGDKVGITMNVGINNTNVKDKHMHIIGARDVMLRNGVITNTWNEAHPRTAIGYSQDRKKVYLIVIDGRQNNYSVGATTGQIGSIMKALGAHTAVNLDGGGSSAMVVNGVTTNKPSDPGGTERTVANGVMVTTKK